MMRWEDDNSTAGEYDVLVDGIARAENQRFGGGQGSRGGIEKVGLYVLGRGRAWFDEVYLGPDFTMGEEDRKYRHRLVALTGPSSSDVKYRELLSTQLEGTKRFLVQVLRMHTLTHAITQTRQQPVAVN